MVNYDNVLRYSLHWFLWSIIIHITDHNLYAFFLLFGIFLTLSAVFLLMQSYRRVCESFAGVMIICLMYIATMYFLTFYITLSLESMTNTSKAILFKLLEPSDFVPSVAYTPSSDQPLLH